MTDFYKNNDDLLRDKLSSHEFAQVPAAWESMSTLLDNQAIVPKRAIGWWWSVPIVAATALTAVISWGIYLNMDPSSQELNTTSKPLAQQEAKQLKNSSNKAQNQLILPQKVQNTPTANDLDAKHKKAATSVVNKKNNVADHSNTKKASTTKPTTVSSKTTDKTAQNHIANTEDSKKAVDQINVALKNAIQENTSSSTANNNYKVYTRRTEIIRQYSITPLRALQNKQEALKTTLTKPENTIGNFGIGDEQNHKNSRVKVGVFGGASAKMYGATNEFSVMPFGGASVNYRVAPRHAVQVGLQYKSMGRLPNANADEGEDRTFMNGTTTSRAHSLKRIDLLEIPLVYQFFPHRKYNIQAGLKGAWLFNTETSNPDFNKMSNKEMGLANFDIGLLLGMEFILNKHWSLGVQYSLGFINLAQQAQQQHIASMEMDINAGVDAEEKVQTLSNPGEIVVPVTNDATHQEMIRLPSSLHNNDVQVLLKYTF